MLDYEKLFRTAPALMVVVSRDLTVVEVSDSYLSSTHTSREGLIGKNLLDAFPPKPGEPDATSPEVVRAQIQLAFETGLPTEPLTVRYDVQAPNGEFEERHWRSWNTPIPKEIGPPDSVVHNVEEVTATIKLQRSEQFERSRAVAAEGAFAAERRRLRSLLDEIPAHVVLIKGPELTYEFGNRAFLAFTGQTSIEGLTLREAWPVPDDHIAMLQSIIDRGVIVQGKETLVPSPIGGEDRYFDFSFRPMFESDGSVSGILVFSLDVTDRVLAQREKATSDERFEIVAKATRDAIWDLDIASNTIWWNEGMTELFGHDRERIPRDARWSLDQIHPEDRVRVERSLDEAIENRLKNWRSEYRSRCADGSYLIVENRAYTLTDSEGLPIRVVGAIADVTEERRETATLAFLRDLTAAIAGVRDPLEIISTVEALLGNFFDADRVAYGEIGPHAKTIAIIRDWSPNLPSMVGEYNLEDFGSRVVEDFCSGRTFVLENSFAELAAGQAAAFDALGIRASLAVPLLKDGSPVACIGVHHGVPVRWTKQDEHLVRQVVDRLFSEIERARLESGLVKANEELEKRVEMRTADLVAKNLELEGFTYSVSHDMRAPLRAMVSNARLLLEDEGKSVSSEGRERLSRLEAAALHMGQLVDDLLQYARLGTREIIREPIDLSRLVKQTAEEVQIERSNCDLSIEIEEGIDISGDPRLIGMAVFNIIDNACKYAKANEIPRISFGATFIDGERAFFIKDHGIGFDMAYVSKLFKPFERLHSNQYPGTGIGLANVRRVFERHGGRVWAEGVPGAGATFFFTL
jgi:PAS domain S-box-containing protein